MPYKQYVEVGRVAMINYGKEYGQLVVIADVIDQNKALVDHPKQMRRSVGFKRLSLTDYKIDIPRCAKKTVLTKAYTDADIEAKFAASSLGKRLARQSAKAAMTDFDRYKARVQRTKKAQAAKKLLASMS